MPRQLPPYDSNGFYLSNGKPDPRGHYGPPQPPAEEEVETALAYLRQLRPTKQANVNSYYLKHRAESWGDRNGMSSYVSNGALIAAAIRLELKIAPVGINAGIAVSRRDIEKLRKQEK
jgi:hypothetical protein